MLNDLLGKLEKLDLKLRLGYPYMKTAILCASICLAISPIVFAQSQDMLNMANPASTNCAANHNGSLHMQTDSKSGGQYGICQVSKTEAYEEWCLYRNDMNINKKICPNLIVLLKDQK